MSQTPSKPKPNQIEAFKAAARDFECEESEEAFRRNFRAVAKAPVEKKPAKR